MNWIIIVLAGHFLNALAFLVDKFLLTKRIPSPFVYAFFIGALGIISLILIPFGFYIPPLAQIVFSLLSGALFIGALVFFFSALKLNEASRVVPLTGGLVPAFTFILAYIFLDERLEYEQILAFVLLVLGGILITCERKGKGSFNGYVWAVVAAFAFAASFVLAKDIYSNQGFINGFIWSRIGGFIMALFFFAISKIRRQILHQPKQKDSSFTAVLFAIGQISGALGFVLVNYSISLASVSIVNATQGVQYVFLLLMVFILAKRFPNIMSEGLSKGELAQKIFAIILISIGIVLIAF